MVREAIENSINKRDETFVIKRFIRYTRQLPCEHSPPEVSPDVLSSISPITVNLGELLLLDLPLNLFTDEVGCRHICVYAVFARYLLVCLAVYCCTQFR